MSHKSADFIGAANQQLDQIASTLQAMNREQQVLGASITETSNCIKDLEATLHDIASPR
jgi:prefoldin subunit 5